MKVEQEVEPSGSSHEREHPREVKPVPRWILFVLAFVFVVIVVVAGVLPRIQARNELNRDTHERAIPTAKIIQPKRSAPAQEVVLPATVQAFIDAPIYARTTGYLRKWYVDIGAHVKA